jgi:hypothetical protein
MWWIAGLVLSVVVVATVTGIVFLTAPKPTGQSQSAPPLGLSAQTLLTSSMRKEPVPGWKTSSEELGLPPGTAPKFLGNVGDHGYFLGITGRGWWLVAIDVSTGRRTAPPVELGLSDNALAFDCVINGPTAVVCVRQDRDPAKPARAWVVDMERGALMYDGPTDLRISSKDNHPNLRQIGNYAVAAVTGEGMHGVGPRAELTWFVPGNGNVGPVEEDWSADAAPQRLAVQGGADSSTTDVVFSVASGEVVKPEVPQSWRFGKAIIYPGGFGYEYSATGEYFSDQVAFFDDSGQELSRPNFKSALLPGSHDVPMVRTSSNDLVLTLDGRTLLELPKSTAMPNVRRIGERLFIANGGQQRSWQQYDLRSGASGKTCEIESLGYSYIASDGHVAVLSGNETPAQGYDLTTCDKLWSLSDSTQSEPQDVWKVNTTLIQRTNDELSSLVAPT